jgi:hypothetical protein
MRILIVLAACMLTGCTALESRETQAWLALHAVDSMQTYRIAQDGDCFHEADSMTREIIGTSPSRRSVVAWAVGDAALHLGVTELLLRTDHPKLARAWQYVRIGVAAGAVAENHSIGIRIGSPNRPRATCNAPGVDRDDEGDLVEILD